MKSQESQPHPVSKPCMASRCDMDYISSINTPNPNLDSHSTGKKSHGFINHGFILWNQSRQQWVGNKRKFNQVDELREPRLSWNATYDSLLGSNKPFTKPVPLSEMVNFLVDVWEQEGMYD